MQQQSINIWLVAMYGDYAPNYCTVTRWFNEFKCGCQSLEDNPRCGQSSKPIT